MPVLTQYTPGAFCWVELMTSDANAAKKFYAQLFNWGVDDMPVGDGTTYHMLKLKDKSVGGMYQQRKEQKNVPSHWNCYVAVDNVDESAKKVEKLGGKTIMPPFDVFEVGRMSAAQDPTGAQFFLWQAKNVQATVVMEPGAMCWNELGTTDEKSATKFYTQLFGWGTKPIPSVLPYTVFSNRGSDIGGMYTLTKEMKGVPPNWMPYFAVADCDASDRKVASLGGKQVIPPTDIPNTGRFAYERDPQGAMFAIIKLNPRP
jgi:predicted enzyme related to lactoylglutathione lyase